MVQREYMVQMEKEGTARAMATELDISPKHAIEIADFIRHMSTSQAIGYLEKVARLESPIPMKRFKRNVSHKRGIPGWAAGRYPVKAAKAYIALLQSAVKNAEYAGLDTESLEIVHIAANKGRTFTRFFPRAMGRATPKRGERVNLEVIVREVA
ncbi:MAG: 50S ribosomal protein L22 [Methanomicrobiales archaeon]|nr:50S ribosomal protein L22 [Methanomicrobiales archaeon]